ncbi:acetyltransferase [Cohnella sp. GCM10027633]|uniref:acetyltransferase n=1 Tax=unclassified Cohnella TaxID=2636738 RepID=UPI00362C9F44
MADKCIVFGGGGHAKVLIDVLESQKIELIGYTALQPSSDELFKNLKFWNENELAVSDLEKMTVRLVNGIGAIGDPSLRKKIFERWTADGYTFVSLIHPGSIVSKHVEIEDGVQIMAGAVVQPGCRIGANSIVNTRASIDHDCVIGRHVHLSPGAVLCGSVIVEDEAHIGAGATIKQNVHIGKGSIVGAGAVVIKDVPSGKTVVGVPAKEAST